MQLSKDLMAHRNEFARAIINKKFEFSPQGILFSKQGVFINGHMESWVNGRDHFVDPNIIPTEGLNHILSTIVGGGTQVNPWYVALFSQNVTPQATLTAATFTATMTEFTGYDEATRVAYVEGAVAAGSVSNTASRAEFSINAPATIYGALLGAQAKSATTSVLLSCSLFNTGRPVIAGDTLQTMYTLGATSV